MGVVDIDSTVTKDTIPPELKSTIPQIREAVMQIPQILFGPVRV